MNSNVEEQKANNLYPPKFEELFGIDLRSLALFRICIAIIVIVDLIILSSDIKAYYTDWGFLPRSVLLDLNNSPWYLSINLMSGGYFFQFLLFLIAFIFAFFLLIGYKTRLSSVIIWFFMLSLHFRNSDILSCADGYLRLLLFWSMFIPLGAYYSLDKTLSKDEILPTSKKVFSIGTVAILFQVIFVYIFCVYHKTAPEWKFDATAVYYALSFDELVTSFGKYLLNFPELLKVLTRFTYWFELLGPFLLFVPICTGPIRTLAVFGFILMHIGFAGCLDLDVFPWVCCIAVVLFLPSWFWDNIYIKFKNLAIYTRIKNSIYHNVILPLKNNFVNNQKPPTLHYSLIENLFVAFCLLYVLMWNISSIKPACKIPDYLKPLGQFFQIEEEWSMFSPLPSTDDGWYVIPGRLLDGTLVDLFKNGSTVTWKKPKLLSSEFKNHYWFKLYENLRQGDNNTQVLNFGRYLCRNWDASHKDGKELQAFKIYFMRETTLPDYKKPKAEKVLLWHHWCVDIPKETKVEDTFLE